VNIHSWKDLIQDESGQDLVEYALVAGLIALALVTSMKGLATGISSAFSLVTSDIATQVP